MSKALVFLFDLFRRSMIRSAFHFVTISEARVRLYCGRNNIIFPFTRILKLRRSGVKFRTFSKNVTLYRLIMCLLRSSSSIRSCWSDNGFLVECQFIDSIFQHYSIWQNCWSLVETFVNNSSIELYEYNLMNDTSKIFVYFKIEVQTPSWWKIQKWSKQFKIMTIHALAT